MISPREPRDDAPFRLITIPFSHFCEKARWALDRLAISYHEEGLPPIVHYKATVPLRLRTVPVLVSRAGVFGDSTDILRYLDQFAPESARLYPLDTSLLREVETLEDDFDQHLGPDTRRVAYWHSFQDRPRALGLFTRGKSGIEKALLIASFPPGMWLMRRAMQIDEEHSAQSMRDIEETFAKMGERLRDGRRYLVGDRFSAADLTFASLGAPVVLPDEYGGSGVSMTEMPPSLADIARRMRETPAGQFLLRLYREERRMVVRP